MQGASASTLEEYHHVDGVFMHPGGGFEKQVVNAALAEACYNYTPDVLLWCLRLTPAF